MSRKSIRLGMLALVLAISAGAAAQTSAPSLANASAQDNASPQNSLFAPRDAPILRNTGKTVAPPDQPLMGHLNLRGQRPQGSLSEQVPAMPPASNEAATNSDADNVGVPRQGHD